MPARTKKKPNKSAKKRTAAKRSSRPAKAKARGKKPAAKAKAKAKKPAKKPSRAPAKAKGKAKKAGLDKAKKAREAAQKREREQREKERQRLLKQREKERVQREREKEREKKAREVEKKRELKAREAERAKKEAERAKEKKAREAEKVREREAQKRAREEERLEREAERERIREEARRQKEEERAARDAEREAYRKAKEAERERLRAEREAAKRALEGKVARATKRAQRAGVGRTSTTRVYRPDAIPNQAGTTRRVADEEQQPRPVIPVIPLAPEPPPPPPPPRVELPETVEERYTLILKRLGETDESFRREYQESFDMSWIYHDSALEGTVYTFQELKTAIDPSITVVPDSSLQPVCEEIRRHKAAIELVRELGEKKRATISVDTIKKIFLTLHPEEGDLKSVKYRKDIPQHRLYFHEYAAPDKIAYKVRQVIDWLNGPEPKKIKHPLRIASRVHYDLLRVFPFALDSGKVVRLLMNLILLRSGYPPSIIHSTERQRYYEALKSSLPTISSMMNEAILNGLASIEKKLDEHDIRR
jgi:hypothetical protein